MKNRRLFFLPFAVFFFLYSSCGRDGTAESAAAQEPIGCLEHRPVRKVFHPDIFYSVEDGLPKTRIQSVLQEECDNGDIIYPDGITVTRYKKDGALSFLLRAEEGRYHHKEKKYTARGEVCVRNFEKKQEMHTQELVWDVERKEIYTHVPVLIVSADEVHRGRGLRASQDFESYTLFSPTGDIQLAPSTP